MESLPVCTGNINKHSFTCLLVGVNLYYVHLYNVKFMGFEHLE